MKTRRAGLDFKTVVRWLYRIGGGAWRGFADIGFAGQYRFFCTGDFGCHLDRSRGFGTEKTARTGKK